MRGFRSIGRRKPGIDRGSYRKVIIEPITVFVSPDSEYKGLEAADLQAIADGFREAMSKALAPDVAVVTEHGPGVLRMRAALSNVMLKKPSVACSATRRSASSSRSPSTQPVRASR